jgi:hypothetical protein
MSTLYKGVVRYIVFKDKSIWYAAGLEFNIVESGADIRIALNNLFDALQGYIESAQKMKGSRVLAQTTDPEYEKMWKIATVAINGRLPFPLGMFGVAKI